MMGYATSSLSPRTTDTLHTCHFRSPLPRYSSAGYSAPALTSQQLRMAGRDLFFPQQPLFLVSCSVADSRAYIDLLRSAQWERSC